MNELENNKQMVAELTKANADLKVKEAKRKGKSRNE